MRSEKIPGRILPIAMATSLAVFLQFHIGGFPVNAQTSRFPTEIYTVENGLSHGTVLYVIKDSCGFIWVATINGINRFDGSRFTQYKQDFSYYYAGFLVSPEGELWAVYPDLTSLRYDFELDTFLNPYADVIERGFPEWDNNGEFWWLVDDTLYQMGEHTDGSVYIRSAINTVEDMGRMYWSLKFPGDVYFAVSSSGMYRILMEGGDVQFIPFTLKAGGREIDPYSIFGSLGFFPDGDSVWMLAESRIMRAGLSGDPGERSIRGRIITLDRPEIRLSKDDKIIMQKWDGSEFLYFRTLHGVYRLSAITWDVEWIYPEEYGILDDKEGLFQLAMYYDQDGILWLGTDKGLVKIVVKKKGFHQIGPEPGKDGGLSYHKLSAVTVDQNDQLWVGSVGGGLFRSRKDKDGSYCTFDRYLHDPADPYSLAGNGISAIFEDSSGDICILAGQSSRQSMIQVIADPQDHPARFLSVAPGGRCYRIAEVHQGLILINRIYNLSWVYDKKKGVSFPFYLDKDMSGYTGGLLVHGPENDPYSYFLTGSGLYQITGKPMYDQQNGRRYAYPEKANLLIDSLVIDYKHFPGWGTGESRANLSVDRVNYWRSLIVTSPEHERELWICTDNIVRHFRFVEKNGYGSDQADGDLRLVNSFGTHNGLSDDKVNELIEDDRHRIWCSTQSGLTCIDPLNDRIYRYYEEDGLPTNKFYWGCHKDKHGNLFFCTNDGLVWFHPDSIVPEERPKVYLTGLNLFNKPLRPGPGSPLKKQVMFAEHLRLHHNENFISFEFAALDFTGTDRLEYRYMLEGLDMEWVDAGSRRMAEYPGLRPGQYRFRVIASNSNGVWSTEGVSLKVTITPPFWLRWWSFVIEGALLLTILFMIIRLRERNLRIRAAELEQKVEEKTHQILEQRKEVDEMKSRFYTNISHEFRTPLTLLISPIEDALKKTREETVISKRILRMMHRNARRLQNLINQLLDISKIESGKIELQLSKANLSDFVRVVASSFYSLAESRQIQYHIDIEPDGDDSCFDADKTEKIITNLLSNAFKFSKEEGTVSLQLKFVNPPDKKHKQAVINIMDTGKGMEQDQLDKIFDRFYQVSDTDTREVEGSGIGLALTRELLDLMHGSIEVESAPGKGTTFQVTFPVSEKSFSEQEIKTMIEGVPSVEVITAVESEQSKHPENVADIPGEEMVLVVEDNIDLRSYITEKFSKQYKVIEAENGETGLSQALEQIPDLVITDLMMPVMGGVEFCLKLKEHPALNHIPVIMLTAKADKDSRIEGFEAEADDYITKPFDAEELQVRVRNLIEQRKKLREKFRMEYFSQERTEKSVADTDPLLQNLFEHIEENYSDFDFSVEKMGNKLHMSRTQFFRKLNALTGESPNELLRMHRMKKAAALIRSGNNNITGIMYEVGFRSSSHFASTFKKYFGQNPSEYRDSIHR